MYTEYVDDAFGWKILCRARRYCYGRRVGYDECTERECVSVCVWIVHHGHLHIERDTVHIKTKQSGTGAHQLTERAGIFTEQKKNNNKMNIKESAMQPYNISCYFLFLYYYDDPSQF